MPNSSLQPVDFHGDTLYITTHENQPYVPMKPVVLGVGVNWDGQRQKLNANRERWGAVLITAPSSSGVQQSLCLPLRKLPGWLMTLQPSRVAEAKRDKIIRYQNECDDVLWAHWQQQAAPALLPLPSQPPLHAANDTITLPKDEYIDLLENSVKLMRSRISSTRSLRQEMRQEIGRLRHQGYTIGEIGGRLHRSQAFVQDVCQEAGWL